MMLAPVKAAAPPRAEAKSDARGEEEATADVVVEAGDAAETA
jgi:hypothetical protein